MEANKIILNGQNILDLTQDTAITSDVAQDKTFHLANGEQATGAFVNPLVGVLDGSATEIVCSDYGVTSLAPERFHNFTNLQKLDLTGVTDIPEYTAYGCSGLTELTIDPNTTNIGRYVFRNCSNNSLSIDLNMNGVVNEQAFYDAKLRSVKGTYSFIGQYAFFRSSSGSILDEVDIKVNGAISSYAFGNYNRTVSSFNLDATSVITTLGDNAFRGFASNRANASTNVFNFDFRNSTFTSIGGGAFAGDYEYKNKYMNIYFPITMTTINQSVFQYTDYCNMFYKNVPSLSNINVFSGAINFKNFFPYNLVQTAKTSTNWSSSANNIVSSIYGYAEENTFTQGQTLPLYDNDGYGLTWYDDVAMTNQVTVVSDPSQIYYCVVGSRVAVSLTITQYQATCVVSDGVNTYANGSMVPIGATLTITGVGEGANTQVYLFTLNGTNISSGDTYVVTSTPIEIKCIYWDGINQPILPNFADNTWDQIALAISTGLHRTMWPISSGSTVSKPITLTDGTVVDLRLADSTANRYEFSDGSGYSQSVLEFNLCIPTAYRMNPTGTNQGGWPASEMSSQTMDIVYNMLPSDLKQLVKEVKVPSATSGSSSTLVYANNKCFLAAASEVYNSYSSYAYNEGAIFEYYNGTANSAKIKQRSGSNYYWWLRSPCRNFSGNFCYVATGGSITGNNASDTYGVSACLVIG